MSDTERTFSGGELVCALLLFAYLAGYAVIRANCLKFGGGISVVPSCIASGGSRTTLYTLYKPMFYVERRCTGRQFTWSPWAVPDL